MKNFKFYLLATLLLSGVSITPSYADTLNYDFTLAGTIEGPGYENQSPVAGSVTGEIIGLQEGTTSLPTDVIIFSAPAALNLNASEQNPYDFGTLNYSGSGSDLRVEISNSQLTFSNFEVRDPNNTIFAMSFNINDATYNSGFLEAPNESYVEGSFTVSAGGPYTPPASPADTPEPSTWALLLGGLGLLAFNSRRCSPRLS